MKNSLVSKHYLKERLLNPLNQEESGGKNFFFVYPLVFSKFILSLCKMEGL